jgi:hypothetical protein
VYKIKFCGVQKLKILIFNFIGLSNKIFEGVEVTIWADNFDRYIYVLKIMSSREKCMAILTKTE